MNILNFCILSPLLGSFIIFFTPKKEYVLTKAIGLFFSCASFFISVFLFIFFDNSCSTYQFVTNIEWVGSQNFFISFGLDGLSIFFFLLTTFLVPICILSFWNIPSNQVKGMFSSFLIIEAIILIVFSTIDLLVFFIFFESILIPMFIVIGIWGSRERRIRAAYFFFIYTLFGSVFILLGILLIYFETGTTDIEVINYAFFNQNKEKLLWLSFFASFSVKVPIVPFHIWLPEAHVEAPTAGSVILAGILLKLGTYGFVRFSIQFFPVACVYFSPFIYTLSILSIIYTSFTAIRQSDMKRIIAYASVAHINVTIVGLFSFTLYGLEGSLLQIFSHGFVSGALFLCVGVLYDRHHTRIVKYYGGIAHTMPLFVFFFLFFTLANIALPGTSSFVGEFLILLGIFQVNSFVAFFTATGIVLGGLYSLWLFNRVSYGNLKFQFISISYDLNRKEFICFIPLFFITLLIGVYPSIFTDVLHVYCTSLVYRYDSVMSFFLN